MTRRAGFTLIELLVVVAILSAAAALALGALGPDMAQVRHDDTANRLDALRRALLAAPSVGGATLPGGYVADNGDLPASLARLTARGDFAARDARAPVFDPVPDAATCADDGGAGTETLDGAAGLLVKGHRGDYLAGRATNGVFRDGWGNESATDDATNWGWAASRDETAQSLALVSLGADGVAGGDPPYDSDRGLAVAADDWLLPIAGWTVTVTNRSGADLAARHLSVSLLVFRNDDDGGHWLRYSTATQNLCLDGDGDGLVDGAPCLQQGASFSFAAGCWPSGPNAEIRHRRIPQGRHLLVLVDTGTAGDPWSADGKPWRKQAGDAPVVRQIDALAGHALPAVDLEMR
ncbi:MAG: prepilin-type N-terminal cleavage/methylation domain-containing protein [Rhodocyclaceae bacterium]|nr:prepilin-type N-terminal cleavage/methylation domain-containing protein [Rhodocyclaceae bacterium]